MPQPAHDPRARLEVLVVDDEPPVCEWLADLLRAEGFAPVCARSDGHAYEALRTSGGFACLIVDVNLGVGATGYDVARFARRLHAALPVIFVSGQAAPGSLERYGVPGALFLEKPFTSDVLLQQVRRLVGENDPPARS